MLVVAMVLAVLLVPLVVYLGTTFYNYFTMCRGEQREVFEEFPHYGGRSPEPIRNLDVVFVAGGICLVEFETTASEEEVIFYYERNLRENGWEVEVSVPPPSEQTEPTDINGKLLPASPTLSARRDDYGYSVRFGEPQDASGASSEPREVMVSMGER